MGNVVDSAGKTYAITAKIGEKMLEPFLNAKVPIEAACDGECCCSTCHCYLPKDLFAKCPEPDEDELDMLDLAVDVQDNSRLACQTIVTLDFEGQTVTLPASTLNLMDDD